jgi:phosphatidylserine/phosphatidylglycerophosphate/cardiolipin synthase-like enzyme
VHNREWHVIIQHKELAETFQKYIEWDFEEAKRLPLEEAVPALEIYLFVPESAFEAAPEARIVAEYFKPLEIDRELDIQPLLTPDRNNRGEGMFLAFATELVERAKSTIDIENQSFSLLEENEEQFERFFNVLVKKQKGGVPVRVIFRDPREFSGGPKGKLALQKTLTRLKDIQFDTDFVKTQKKCHTKAIIVDSADADNATVLFGSHNLTTSGSLFNRDASVLVRDNEVAQYFQKIFDFDWEVLATQSAEEEIGGVRVAKPGEETPAGFRKVSLEEFLGEADS